MAFIGVEVAQEREVLTATLGGSDVRDNLAHHAAPLCVARPLGVTQGHVCRRHHPVAVVEVVVVHVQNAFIFLRQAGEGSRACVMEEIRVAAAIEPTLQARLQRREQLVPRLQFSLCLRNAEQLRSGAEAFAYPVSAAAHLGVEAVRLG